MRLSWGPVRPRDDQATASLISFLVASAIFAVSFAAVIQVSLNHRDDTQNSRQADHFASAAGLADTLLGQPGQGWYDGSPCDADGDLEPASFDPDGVQRFGLAEETCAVALEHVQGRVANVSYDKLQNLFGAGYQADPANGALDYEEARTSLNLVGAGLNFHLRSWPLLPSVEAALNAGHKDPYMRLLYIGDYSSSGGGGPPPYAKGVVDQGDQVVVWLNVTNNGATSTIFDAFFEIDLKSDRVAFTLHTKVLAAGESGNVSFTLLKTADWEWKHNDKKWVDVEIHDKDTKLVDTTISLAAVTMTSAVTRANAFAESEKLSTLLSGSSVNAKYYHEAHDGKGKLVDFGDWTYRLVNESGNIRTDILATMKEGNVEHAFTAVGSYRAELWNDALSVAGNWDHVNIAAAEPGPYLGPSTFTPGPSVQPEVSYIDALVESFDANVFGAAYHQAITIPYAAGGDVFPDIKDVMNDELPRVLKDSQGNPTLDQYTTVIVGSNVDHNAMTSQAAKATIKDWVYAGGTLIVLGSDDQSVNWLQPIFHVALDGAGSPVLTPDGNHPVLNVPNDLDPETYDAHGSAWHFNREDDRTHFAHVVTSGEDDVLAVSDPGAFGKGRVLLTSWRAYDLTYDAPRPECNLIALQATCAGLQLLSNFMTVVHRGLYLDYGPSIPESRPVGVQSVLAQVWHPELHQTIEMYLIVYVF